jgi:putative tricarboxylic transport membrane protein
MAGGLISSRWRRQVVHNMDNDARLFDDVSVSATVRSGGKPSGGTERERPPARYRGQRGIAERDWEEKGRTGPMTPKRLRKVGTSSMVTWRRVGGAVAGAALAALATEAAAEAVSFRGKTVTVIVGAEAGGGTDATARLIAPYLRKYLPGEPTIVVQNMPGASGITSLNYFSQRAQPDGLAVMMGSISTVDPIVFRNLSSHYDPKTFRIAGGIGRGGSIIFVTRAAEPRLYNKSAAPIVIGSVMGMPRPAMQPALWCIEYLGWNAVWVSGYHGTNETMLAFDRGEVDMTSTGNIFAIQDRLVSGRLKIITQTGAVENGKVVPRAEFGDVPLFADLMKGRITDPVAQKAFDYWTALNTGDKWMGLPPATSDAMVEAYRRTFARIAADKDFLERGEKISEGFTPMGWHDVRAIIHTLADTTPDAVEYTKGLMRKQGLRVQ